MASVEKHGKETVADKTEIEDFLAWFEQHGGHLCDSFHYVQDEMMGLSIFTTADKDPNVEAVLVPKSCCITAQLARHQILALMGQSQSEQVVEEIFTGKEWIVLYIFLHKIWLSISSGSQSASESTETPSKRARIDKPSIDLHLLHVPYINLLPEETLSPLHYNRAEVQLLQSTPLYGHAAESRRNGRKSCIKAIEWMLECLEKVGSAEAQMDRLVLLLQRPPETLADDGNALDIHGEVEKWGKDEESWSLLKEWRWAETAYGSRAFPPRLLGEEEGKQKPIAPVLIPGLDSFNHSRMAKVTWTWHNTHPDQHITLTLHQALVKGDQVFNSYGPKSNEDLLASYGFVNEGMDDDTVTLKLGGHHQSSSQQHYWRFGEACPLSLLDEVRAVLREAQNAEESGSNSEKGLLMEEGEAIDTIACLLEQKIAAFESTQDEVDEAVKSESSIRQSVKDNIAVYRRGQIRILQSALSQVQTRLDQIEEQFESQSI